LAGFSNETRAPPAAKLFPPAGESDGATGRPKKEPIALDHIGPGLVVKPPKVAKVAGLPLTSGR
jgi:hypothetical protein